METISAVIITFNEERNIARCIDSLLCVADEIVVVDSFSTDATEHICKEKNVRFIQRKWAGYSDTKNYANSCASNDWILSLDADEALSEKLKQSILSVKKEGLKGTYSFNRLTNYCGTWVKHGGWYPDSKTRLFNRKEAEWTGLIHEHLAFSQNLPTLHLKGDCLHYSYYTIEEHWNQTRKFSAITSQMLFEKGKKANFAKRFLSPIVKFVRDYFFKLGFLHGVKGFTICKISAYATFIKYQKLHQLINAKNRK